MPRAPWLVFGQYVLDILDGLSNYGRMSEITLTWKLVDDTAAELGAEKAARFKWRQAGRGVPAEWRIKIVQFLMARGVAVPLADFDKLQPTPGRIAA